MSIMSSPTWQSNYYTCALQGYAAVVGVETVIVDGAPICPLWNLICVDDPEVPQREIPMPDNFAVAFQGRDRGLVRDRPCCKMVERWVGKMQIGFFG